MKEKVMEWLKIGLLSFAVTLVMVAIAITMENSRDIPRNEIAAAITDNPRFNYDCEDKICDVTTLSMEYIVDCNDECIVIQDSERFH